MRRWTLVVALAMLVIVTSCAAGPNTREGIADSSGDLAGLWLGLWHGIIAPITFLISLFSDTINVYDVHNDGNWYNAGFVIGAGILGGGVIGACKRR